METRINYTPLESLRFAPLEFFIEAKEDLHLPRYKGSALRGGFGHAFLHAVCMTKTYACPPCLLKSSCVYFNIFESRIEKQTADRLRIGSDAPHPYVLEPPTTEENLFPAGSRISYHVVLIGEAMRFLPHFILTFQTQGDRFGLGRAKGKFTLVEVKERNGNTLYTASAPDTFGPPVPLTAHDLLSQPVSSNPLHLRFLTPTRIKARNGHGEQSLLKLSESGHFWLLAESLYHRLFTLAQLYCGAEPLPYPRHPFDFARERVRLTHADIRWDDWERHSNRQRTRMKLGGFVGEAKFEGDLREFIPLFRLGEALHIGKGTSFGLGKFVVNDAGGGRVSG
jgi:hypothetical protein